LEELTLRIILESPPADVDFGLQKGRGNDYEIVQKQRSGAKDPVFEFTIGVKPGPDFAGPFVQGPRNQRFVYIDIGTYAGQTNTCWSRRLKVPLIGITQKMIDSQTVLEVRTPAPEKMADQAAPQSN
jgi:hypothetical protein